MQIDVWVEAQSLGIALSVRRYPGGVTPGLGFDEPKPMKRSTLRSEDSTEIQLEPLSRLHRELAAVTQIGGGQ